jgi:hypothetical protein
MAVQVQLLIAEAAGVYRRRANGLVDGEFLPQIDGRLADVLIGCDPLGFPFDVAEVEIFLFFVATEFYKIYNSPYELLNSLSKYATIL